MLQEVRNRSVLGLVGVVFGNFAVKPVFVNSFGVVSQSVDSTARGMASGKLYMFPQTE
jgi:hypothetical protein